MENFENESDGEESPRFADPEDSEVVAKAKLDIPDPAEYKFDERGVILYNLAVGATAEELQWTYEGHDNFSALPTFGVIPQFLASSTIPMDWLPSFNPVRNILDCIKADVADD